MAKLETIGYCIYSQRKQFPGRNQHKTFEFSEQTE